MPRFCSSLFSMIARFPICSRRVRCKVLSGSGSNKCWAIWSRRRMYSLKPNCNHTQNNNTKLPALVITNKNKKNSRVISNCFILYINLNLSPATAPKTWCVKYTPMCSSARVAPSNIVYQWYGYRSTGTCLLNTKICFLDII